MTYLSISERWCSISTASDHCILIIFQLIISAFFLFHLFVAQQCLSALFIARCNNSWRRASLASLLIGSKFSRGSSHTQRRRRHKSVNRSAEAHAVDAIVDCESPVLPFVVVQFVCPCGHPHHLHSGNWIAVPLCASPSTFSPQAHLLPFPHLFSCLHPVVINN